jgi:hypothetical protein
LNEGSKEAAVIDVHYWFSKATLDAYVGNLEQDSNITLIDQKQGSAQVLLTMTSAP